MKKILFAASECVPFVKTGGLADVVGSLPKAFPADEYDVRVILPKYMCIPVQYRDQMRYITSFYMDLGHLQSRLYVGILELQLGGMHFYFIDNEHYFGGGSPYYDMGTDIEKFSFFSKAVLAALPLMDFIPDIIHCHDWQTGLIPVYLHTLFREAPHCAGIQTIMTIHNLRFQGIQSVSTVRRCTGLPDYAFTPDRMEFNGDANLLKGGMVFANYITTVSDTYAEEIQTPYFGEGLDSVLLYHSSKLRGIVNGIDYEDYNPATDERIAHRFTVSNFRKMKPVNKSALQQELGLDQEKKKMLIGMVSRLTDQKGFDLVARVLDELCQDYVQIVVLGTGDQKYEDMFRHFAWKYGGSVAAHIGYSDELAHRIYASSDAFLMPSGFEPCGLSQIISLRYGTVPIVRETGGLRDTVQPYNEYENTGTGFSFSNYNAHEMLDTIRYAEKIFFDYKANWNRIAERGMQQDFSWKSSSRQYMDLYDSLTGGKNT